MSLIATIEGRTLRYGATQVSLDRVSQVALGKRIVRTWRSETAREVARGLEVSGLLILLLIAWETLAGSSGYAQSYLACFAITVLAWLMLHCFAGARGLMRIGPIYFLRLDSGENAPPVLLFQSADPSFLDQVCQALREAMLAQGTAFKGTISLRDRRIRIEKAGTVAPAQAADVPVPSGVDDVRIVDGHLVLSEQVIAFGDIEEISVGTHGAVYSERAPPILWWGGIVALGYAAVRLPGWDWLNSLAVIASAAVALCAYYGHAWLIRDTRREVAPRRATVELKLRSGLELPLFTTADVDFALRAAARLDALRRRGNFAGGEILVDWRRAAIGRPE